MTASGADGGLWVRGTLFWQWLAAKCSLVGLVITTAAIAGVDARQRAGNLPAWVMYRFAHWDSNLYAAIAIRGYPQVGYAHSYFSFLPGFPWAMRTLGAALGVEVRWAALMIVTASSVVCVVALHAVIIELTGSPEAGRWGVLTFLAGPMAIFFTVDYTEAPFLALVMTAWLAGRRRAWVAAGALTAVASTLRVTGPLVSVALLVMFLTGSDRHERAPWSPRVLALGLGPAVFLAYAVWLHRHTGSWSTWTTAQRVGFGRASTWPWVGGGDAVHKITVAATWHLRVVRVLELAAAAGSWVVTAGLLRRRWWAEATFAGLCAVSMSCSTIFDSSPRYLSAVFPLYALLGLWLARGTTRRQALYFATSVALCFFAAVGWGLQWWVA